MNLDSESRLERVTRLLRELLEGQKLYPGEMASLFEVGWRGGSYKNGLISETWDRDKFYLNAVYFQNRLPLLKEISDRFGKPTTKQAMQMILDEIELKKL